MLVKKGTNERKYRGENLRSEDTILNIKQMAMGGGIL